MFKTDFQKYFFLSILVSVGYFFSRVHTFDLPFFWDESWVYAPAIKKMGEDFCLLPSCANEYTRGHPLLFHAIGGAWVKIFGSGFYSLRAFAFAITMALQYSCYYIVSSLLNPRVAFYFSLILILQNIIFAQSTFVFPEISLALAAMWVLYFYLRNKRLSFFISGLLLCLIKEQGLLLLIAIFLWELFLLLRNVGMRSVVRFKNLKNIFFLISPVIGIVLFLLMQRIQKGYWFYPEHIQLIKHDLRTIGYQLRVASEFLLMNSGRYILSFLFLLIFLFFGKVRPLATRIILLGFILVLVKTLSGKWGFSPVVVIVLSSISLLVIFYRFVFSGKEQEMKINFIGPASFFILIYLSFCSFNFFTERYLAVVLPFVLLLFLGLIDHWLTSVQVKHLIFLFMSVVSVFFLLTARGFGDTSPRNYQAVQLQQKVVQFALDSKWQKHKILTSFVMANNFQNPASGYVSVENKFDQVINLYLSSTELPDYVIQLFYEKDKNVEKFVATHHCKLIKSMKSGEAEGAIYKVMK